MRQVFNRDAVICTVAMLIVAAVLLGLAAADRGNALTTCQATHSADVCEFTLR